MPGVIEAVNVVSQLHRSPGTVGVTAIDKRPVEGAVAVRPYGLYRDVQADRKHHGGLFQAVYAFSREEYRYWRGQFGRDLEAGEFGENLTTSGIALDDLEIGATVRAGSAVLEATAPRTPCNVFADFLERKNLIKEFTAHGRTGVYFRVVRRGEVSAGDQITVLATPGHGVSVADVFGGVDEASARALIDWSVGTGTALHREVAAIAARASGVDVASIPTEVRG
ncbi:MOSC domain-containing protein [Acidipropionibacterium virtanenii]|uniref:MOSC domain-containing protein n=1 Tax=Acidipropionibacterium virtanenii TaxID=2057246 RepID=A0A344UXN8_9ACTN|nr:MOSC domain-containing protein [Acidipropionibacterium virtanenii]AXE40036.1 hypothetical protein JS278_02902 [Acidipropionibacterium virtanenii]